MDSLSGEIAALLYREARLLDERRLDEWLRLFSDDASYWAPLNPTDADPSRDAALFYVDRRGMEERVWRLQSGNAFSQDPPSRTQRLITNLEVSAGADGRTAESLAGFLILEVRRDRQNVHGGRYTHRFRREDAGWKITAKRVDLVAVDLPAGNLTFLL